MTEYRVERVSRTSKKFRDVLRDLCRFNRPGKGRRFAIDACLGSETSRLAVAWFSGGRVAGAASYRVDVDRVKRINTGAVVRRRGIGTALVKFIAKENPGLPMWSKNTPEGTRFARKLGMRPAGRAGQHNKHVWTAKQVANWANV